jgi:hypothetical protein
MSARWRPARPIGIGTIARFDGAGAHVGDQFVGGIELAVHHPQGIVGIALVGRIEGIDALRLGHFEGPGGGDRIVGGLEDAPAGGDLLLGVEQLALCFCIEKTPESKIMPVVTRMMVPSGYAPRDST